MRTDAAASAAGIPNLVLRPYAGEEDLSAIVRIINAENEADHLDERLTEESERSSYAHPSAQFDPARDVVLAELDGIVVGVAGQDWVDTRDGELREHRLWGAVDPAHRRRGIGTALLADNERRARAIEPAPVEGRAKAFGSFAGEGRPAAALLERSGYEMARWFFEMVRPSLDGVAAVPLPAGFELRPAGPGDYPSIWRANREAFRDHWGGSDESEAAMRRFLETPDTDPTLWLIAWEGSEIVGGVINAIFAHENEAMGYRRGWLESVFTRRAWRRRGLAQALIARSLLLLRERGMTSAGLGVDAANPSGALGLYETAGFAVHERFVAWRKPMEEGPLT